MRLKATCSAGHIPGAGLRRTPVITDSRRTNLPWKQEGRASDQTCTVPDLMLSYQSWIIVTIEGWTGPSSVHSSQGNWLTLKQNILLTGATGSGKTFRHVHLVIMPADRDTRSTIIALKRWWNSAIRGMLMEDTANFWPRLNNSDLLLLDDWGLEPLSSEQRSDLLEIVDLMYQRGSIIVVSQLPVENWYKMIGDSTHADAILDRLVHGSIKIELKGESMRKIQSPLTEGDQWR